MTIPCLTTNATCFMTNASFIARALLEDSKSFELELLLSSPYDNQPARFILTAGAGGTEAITIGWRISRECTNDMLKEELPNHYRRRANWRSSGFQNGRNAY